MVPPIETTYRRRRHTPGRILVRQRNGLRNHRTLTLRQNGQVTLAAANRNSPIELAFRDIFRRIGSRHASRRHRRRRSRSLGRSQRNTTDDGHGSVSRTIAQSHRRRRRRIAAAVISPFAVVNRFDDPDQFLRTKSDPMTLSTTFAWSGSL